MHCRSHWPHRPPTPATHPRPCAPPAYSEIELQKAGAQGAFVIDDARKYPGKENVGPLLGATGGFAGGEKGIKQLVEVRGRGGAVALCGGCVLCCDMVDGGGCVSRRLGTISGFVMLLHAWTVLCCLVPLRVRCACTCASV